MLFGLIRSRLASRIAGFLAFLVAGVWLPTWHYFAEFIRAALYERLLHMMTPNIEAFLTLEYALQYGVPIALVAVGFWLFLWTGKKPAPIPKALKREPTHYNAKVSPRSHVAPNATHSSAQEMGEAELITSSQVDLEKLFAIDRDRKRLWLKYLPDTPDKRAFHTMLAILLGYKAIFDRDAVPKLVMNESLQKSRLKKPIGPEWLSSIASGPLDFYDSDEIYFADRDNYKYDNYKYVEKASLSRGGAFKLTNDGYDRARTIVEDLIERG